MKPRLYEITGYLPKDENHISTALRHSSFVNENPGSAPDNERYEFIGDSVLGFVTAEYLYQNYPSSGEGELTRLRAAIICEKNLAECARTLELGNYILLGRGETLARGYEKPSILSDCLEALIGGIYLDGGVEVVRKFINDKIISPYLISGSNKDVTDHKSLLQEKLQQNGPVNIQYMIISETGPEHERIFTAEVSVNGTVLGTGKGKNKKQAEQEAAKAANAGK